jgi:hypothetical protein
LIIGQQLGLRGLLPRHQTLAVVVVNVCWGRSSPRLVDGWVADRQLDGISDHNFVICERSNPALSQKPDCFLSSQ